MYDIVNKSQSITLPVVAINATNIQRSPERVHNKHDSFYYNNTLSKTPGSVTRHRAPVPVQISLTMSILAGYQLDLEQIASNFIAYFNPYIILSTKVPTELGPGYELEVRTKALWDGGFSISTPIELQYAEKFRRVGETNFTLDAWIYPESVEDVKPIYFIDANFYAISQKILDTSSFYYLSGETFSLSTYPPSVQGVDKIQLSGTPTITNIFFASSGRNIELDTDIIFSANNTNRLLLYGHNYDHLDYVILSAMDVSIYGQLTSFSSIRYGSLSGVILRAENYNILNNNIMEVFIPTFSLSSGLFSIITYNAAGWDTTSDKINMSWSVN